VLPLGSISGVKVSAQWTLLVAVGVAVWAFGLVDGVLASLGLVASVMAHELAHAWVAVRRGVGVERIELGAFGGSTALHASVESARHELAISLAGPAASAVITLATALLAWSSGIAVLVVLAIANGVLFVSNAAPILPLDGGRALRALLVQRGVERVAATRHVSFMNALAALVLAACGVIVWTSLSPLFGAPLLATSVFVWLLGALEVRRVNAEVARANALHHLAFDPLDAPWARR
jgi:Zn-dependent protease